MDGADAEEVEGGVVGGQEDGEGVLGERLIQGSAVGGEEVLRRGLVEVLVEGMMGWERKWTKGANGFVYRCTWVTVEPEGNAGGESAAHCWRDGTGW